MRRTPFISRIPVSLSLTIRLTLGCLFFSGTGQAAEYWKYYSGENTIWLPLRVYAQQFGETLSSPGPKVYVSPIYIAPHFTGNEAYTEPVDKLFKNELGYLMTNSYSMPYLMFPLLADHPEALDHCFVQRYTEKTNLNPSAQTEPLKVGEVSSLCVRHDTISLRNLLLKGRDTIEAPGHKAYFVYHLEPGWTAAIQDAPSEYGSRSLVQLEADITMDEQIKNYLTPHVVMWRYAVGAGPKRPIPSISGTSRVSFYMQDMPEAQPGDNILIDAGTSLDGKHLKIIRFYPELPRLQIPTQLIDPTDDRLKSIHLRLPFALNAALEENFTTLTCYKSISIREDGVFKISESEVLFQTNISGRLSQRGDYYIDIPENHFLEEGTYYLTVEGTVKGQTNRPDHNGSYSAKSLSAMFPCYTMQVIQNKLPIQDLSVTPAKCAGASGKISFSYTQNKMGFGSNQYVVYEWLNGQWQVSPYFTTNISSSAQSTTVTAAAAAVPQGEHRFAFRHYHSSIGEEAALVGHTEFDGSIPVVPPLEWTMTVKHISGTVIENGTARTTADGHIVIGRQQIKNGTPPYAISYGTIDGNGEAGLAQNLSGDTLHVSKAGQYYFILLDKNACSDVAEREVQLLEHRLGLSVSEDQPISCQGSGDGILLAEPNGNVDSKFLDITWKDQNGTELGKGNRLGHIQPGIFYTAEVRHRLYPNLKTSAFLSIREPEAFSIASSSVSHVKCFGASTGSAYCFITGGTPPLNGVWSNYKTGFRIENVPAGKYTLRVTDQHGCTGTYAITVRQPASPLRIVIDSIRHVHYNAQGQLQLGYLDAHAEGGTPPLGKVSHMTFALPRKNQIGGSFPLTVGDANQCTADTTIVIESYDRLSASITKQQEVSCFNGYDGACMLWIHGGLPPYTIRWSNGSTGQSLSGLTAGTYRATVTDHSQCSTTAEVIFNEPSPIRAYNLSVNAVSYTGYLDDSLPAQRADGRITAFIQGGTPPYRYTWLHQESQQQRSTEVPVLENCATGHYRLMVFDERSCFATFMIDMPAVSPLQAKVDIIEAIDCHGRTNGRLLAKASGGTPPYRYTWRALDRPDWTPNDSDTAIQVPAGRYEAVVTDAAGVSAIRTVVLREPERLNLTTDRIQTASYGGSMDGVEPDIACDGSVQVTVSGGSGQKRLCWYNAANERLSDSALTNGASHLTELCGGVYRLYAEDANGCRDSLSVTVPQAPVLSCTVQQTERIPCQGDREAMAQASVTGGEPPYQYRFRYEGARMMPADGDPMATTMYGNDTTEAGEETDTLGGAELVFPMFWHLQAGIYTFFVTDRNGIESRFRFHIDEPDTLQGHLRLQASPCHAPILGTAEAIVTGGTPPYTYQWWHNGLVRTGDTPVLDSMDEGQIEVRIQDRNGCPLVLSGTMAKPEPLDVRATVSEEHYTGSLYGHLPLPATDGEIHLDVLGGTPPYRYAWATASVLESDSLTNHPLPDTTAVLSRLAQGTYIFYVTDAHGCRYDKRATIAKTPDLVCRLQLSGLIRCADRQDGCLQALVQGGTPPYRYDWQHNHQAMWQDGPTADSLESGLYQLCVTDAKGVSSRDSFFLSAPQPLRALSVIKAVNGYGASDGRIDCLITGGRPPYTVLWQGETEWLPGKTQWEERLPDSLWSGTYHLQLTDSSGCRFAQSYTVESPDSLALYNTRVFHCQGTKVFLEDTYTSENNGRIRAYLQGGVPPYRIIWTRTADTVTDFMAVESGDVGLADLAEGRYRLSVTDAHGYSLNRDFEVELSTAVRALLTAPTPILCHGDSACLAIQADGGKAPYTYRWYKILQDEQDEAADGTDILATAVAARREIALPYTSALSPPLPSGHYRVEIEDVYGVVANDSLFLNQPLLLRLAADLTPLRAEWPTPAEAGDPADTLRPAGLLCPRPQGGCPPYRYEWAHGDTADHIAYRRGHAYAVTVYDRHRCAVSQTFPFDGQAELEARISCTQAVSCHGVADGALDVEILGGQPPYRVLWQRGDTGTHLDRLPAGRYELSVMDADGQTCGAVYHLTEPAPLDLRIAASMPRCAGRSDGFLTAEATGGTYPYRYRWQDGPELAAYHGLPAGLYRLTTTDRNGCVRHDSILLAEPAPLRITLATYQPVCPAEDGRLQAEAAGGTPPYAYHWHHAEQQYASASIQNARIGYHLLSVYDSLQCQADTNVTIARAEPLQWKPLETRYLCAGQSALLEPEFYSDARDLIAFWTHPDGRMTDGPVTKSGQDGLHKLTMIQYGYCLYTDTVRLITVDDTVSCQFWISTRLLQNETVTAVDVSYPPSDSSQWSLPPEAELLYAEGPYAEFHFHDTGSFDITLTSYRGYCSQSKTTTVHVLSSDGLQHAVPREPDNPFLGLTAAPNPATGQTQIRFKMQAETDIEYLLIEAVSGRICRQGRWQTPEGDSGRQLDLPERHGLYILVLHTGQMTKHLKIMVSKHR